MMPMLIASQLHCKGRGHGEQVACAKILHVQQTLTSLKRFTTVHPDAPRGLNTLACGFGFDCQCVAHATWSRTPPWLKVTSNTLAFLIGCPNVGIHARHGTSRVRFL